MDFGCVFFASPDAYKDVALAEKMGFTHGWLYDSQMLGSDVYAALALCAVNTRRLIIGPGVTNPLSRIAPVTACAIATINALAPGRVVLGIGTGNTARRKLGMTSAVVVADGVILFGAVGPSLIDFVMDRVRAGAERAGRKLSSIYTLCMTAFHLTRPGQKLESTEVRRAVGPFVASSSNIFALAAPDKSDLPSDLRDDITKFAAAYKVEDEPAERRHL